MFDKATQNYNTWAGAEAEAEAAGGHLVTINDAAENAWLTEQFKGYYDEGQEGSADASLVWIGLMGIPDHLAWVDGEPVTYVASIYPPWGVWRPLPPDGSGTEFGYLHTATHYYPGTWWNCAQIDSSGVLHDTLGIIEISVPEPSTIALLGVGMVGLLVCARWRRRTA